ncbi:histidinol-phosphate transaminase [Microbulbifer thermotolerans]|uniref:Histidinol-phosphate aminotransferase n=1 Tax=Microbulbifer thermotolerans TaxID=252514 RepID=A0A143HNJ8_MICTH|nr:histidinol-phosphate transaminase [Microbulbifer thermotolerans]AMX03289.1 histidinol-phosphate transaminase [Microbulbifer thermotolerans]MCX2780844.1 histidinol-phosphate transaminase [Microbulbifer thermotolerans]MCX2784151.1 histidinol-phosphate transaminase [Microbulbifer thermotolerans]MCX2794377.1 histidinol-phosphate transaminase [Microbulbifer thermotolerans]MCX2801027.1 histidinol-phosphate transaminase [Microbulbifer thermotolerans]
MSNAFWSPALARLEPYVPGEQPRGQSLIKLNTNENPYPPSPRALEVLSDPHLADALRRYPDPESGELREVIGAHFGLTSEQVFVGNGSDEVLAHSFYSFFQRDEPLLFPDITYSFYPVYCQLYGIDWRTPALREDFRIDVEDYSGAAAGVILPNPNAPSGRCLPLADIERLLQLQPQRVVVIDEAYIDFGGDSAVTLIDRYPNLLVIRTLSKSYSLAGLRLGFALGQAHLIEGLSRTKNSFNSYPVDAIAQRVAAAAICDSAYFKACCDKVIASRSWTTEALRTLGFDVVPSKANFILARPPGISAEALYRELRARNILVRYFNKPRISEYLRISIGTETEMQALVQCCKEITGKHAGGTGAL